MSSSEFHADIPSETQQEQPPDVNSPAETESAETKKPKAKSKAEWKSAKMPWSPKGFYIENGLLMRRVKDEKSGEFISIKICRAMKLIEVTRHIATDEIYYLIEFEVFGKLVRELIPNRNLEGKKLMENHLSRGAPFRNQYTNAHIVDYIEEQGEGLTPIELSPILGWIRRNDELAFVCGDYALVEDNGSNNGVDRFIRYCGKLRLSIKGTADEAIAGLNPFLKDSIPLQVAASFGLAAPLVYPLEINEVNTIAVNLAPDSTSGKSTVASVAVSMNASPVQSKEGLNQKCYKTLNHLTQMLCGNHGFPFGLDEIGIAKFTQDEAFGYLLASGIEKGRYNSEPDISGYGLDEWWTLIVSTGEKYIVNDKIPDGAKIRIVEMNESWTQSAEQSDSLMAFLKEQHGTIGLRFVKELLTMGEPALKAEYSKVLEIVQSKAPPDKLAQRFAKTLAVIVTAAVLGNKLIGLEINAALVTDFLLRATTLDSMEVPLAERAVEYIKSKILEIDKLAFSPPYSNEVKKSGYLETYITDRDGSVGKVLWETMQTPVELLLTVERFENMVVKINNDAKIVKKALIAGGYLIGQSNGKDKTIYYKKRSFRGSELTMIGFDTKKIGIEIRGSASADDFITSMLKPKKVPDLGKYAFPDASPDDDEYEQVTV